MYLFRKGSTTCPLLKRWTSLLWPACTSHFIPQLNPRHVFIHVHSLCIFRLVKTSSCYTRPHYNLQPGSCIYFTAALILAAAPQVTVTVQWEKDYLYAESQVILTKDACVDEEQRKYVPSARKQQLLRNTGVSKPFCERGNSEVMGDSTVLFVTIISDLEQLGIFYQPVKTWERASKSHYVT